LFIVIASIALGVCAFVPEAALANEPTANKIPAMPPNIVSIPPDLVVPPVADGEPVAGKRVRGSLPEFRGTAVHHLLFLPTDWKPGGKYPVIVEYAGNGNYRNGFGDVSDGSVEGSNLGYGISGGEGFIWIAMPFVDPVKKQNATQWWGDADASADYCVKTVRSVCEQYGGDPQAVVLAGFSRGAIACNYIGLRNDEIARLWAAFVAHSHYDGVIEKWPYAEADRGSALTRLGRLKGRPVFVSQEGDPGMTRRYIESTGMQASFTFLSLPYPNHTDAWVLRDLPEREKLRDWVQEKLSLPR
jgi:hypothetical protein